MFLRFAYRNLLFVLLPLLLLALVYRLFFYKAVRYKFPLTSFLKNKGFVKKTYRHKVFLFLRFSALLVLALLTARPQWVDERSSINVDGIDMVITLDVSASMAYLDDLNDARERIVVAKAEAIRFIEQRTNDPIGVVIFGGDAVSLCPLTLDKSLLKEVVGGLYLGFINQGATFLGTGLATAVNRLRKSTAKSKVIILLTDGIPSDQDPISPSVGMQMAKEFGIKVYTIAIGGTGKTYIKDPYRGVLEVMPQPINLNLLKKIADETGGVFFRANNSHDMRVIYNKIDALEKTTMQAQVFHNYYEAFLKIIWLFVALFVAEFILRIFLWRGL